MNSLSTDELLALIRFYGLQSFVRILFITFLTVNAFRCTMNLETSTKLRVVFYLTFTVYEVGISCNR